MISRRQYQIPDPDRLPKILLLACMITTIISFGVLAWILARLIFT